MPCCSATTMCRAACHGHLASLRISRRSEKTRDISHTSKDVFYNRGKKLLGLTLCSGLRLFWIHRALVHCVLLNLKNKNFCSIKFDPAPLPKGHVLFPMRLLGLHTHRHHTLAATLGASVVCRWVGAVLVGAAWRLGASGHASSPVQGAALKTM